jgi:hypothetical protein
LTTQVNLKIFYIYFLIIIKESNFGSKCLLSEKYLTSIIKSPIFLNIIENAKAKEKINKKINPE